jgi:hypothetical protein
LLPFESGNRCDLYQSSGPFLVPWEGKPLRLLCDLSAGTQLDMRGNQNDRISIFSGTKCRLRKSKPEDYAPS